MVTHGFSELTCTKLYPKYLEFRHQVFNEILKYNQTGNPVFNFQAFSVEPRNNSTGFLPIEREFGVEYDSYDIPKTLHLAYIQDPGRVMGCLRFLPTDGHYMIKDNIERGVWKNVELLVDKLPMQPDIYEASRIAVAPHLGRGNHLHEIILDNLVYANIELACRLGIKKMVGIMYDRVWQSVYCKRGVPITYLSKPFTVDDGLPIIIGEIDTSERTLDKLNNHYADKIAKELISPPEIDHATWLMHYNHVNKRLPLPKLIREAAEVELYALSH